MSDINWKRFGGLTGFWGKVAEVLFLCLIMIAIVHAQGPRSLMPDRVMPDSAYAMDISNNWHISEDLPKNAALISLQGVVNQYSPQLYFIYPPDYKYTFAGALHEYYRDSRGIGFPRLPDLHAALRQFQGQVEGYVVWDTTQRTSLIVAYTIAGLEESIVVTGDQVSLAQEFGLEETADLRGKFQGMTDAEIYRWAYQRYWDRCSKEYIVYLGGASGKRMMPGVADFGMTKDAFFTDLSADPEDSAEYHLVNRLFREMEPMGMLMGWHSYAKDSESQLTTLASSYVLRTEGLNTLPNMSFNQYIPLSEGFEFENNHTVDPGKTYVPKKKVYLGLIQTDCLGIGSWLKPGRGKIPYAWEVTMNWVWLAPAMVEYFYEMATPNDYFIGSLSGPGYMYPKAIPPAYRGEVADSARALMETLDLRIFEIMDYSGNRPAFDRSEENADLPKSIVDTYYRHMPDALGFVNGYGPAFTYDVREGRPFVSYDYYLSPERDAAEAAADLEELARLNPKRPYFLLMHVRETSSVERVVGILDRLGPEFEVVALDRFMKMAGHTPTFQTRFLKNPLVQHRSPCTACPDRNGK